MKRFIQCRFICFFIIVCVSLTAISFVKSCYQALKGNNATIEATDRVHDNQQFLTLLMSQIIMTDNSVTALIENIDDWEKKKVDLQSNLNELTKYKEEAELRFNGISGFEELDNSLHQVVQRGFIILSNIKQGTAASDNIITEYYNSLTEYYNIMVTFEEKISKNNISSFEEIKRSAANERANLFMSGLYFVLILISSILIIYKIKRNLFLNNIKSPRKCKGLNLFE